jgi:hypothetical protein
VWAIGLLIFTRGRLAAPAAAPTEAPAQLATSHT